MPFGQHRAESVDDASFDLGLPPDDRSPRRHDPPDVARIEHLAGDHAGKDLVGARQPRIDDVLVERTKRGLRFEHDLERRRTLRRRRVDAAHRHVDLERVHGVRQQPDAGHRLAGSGAREDQDEEGGETHVGMVSTVSRGRSSVTGR